MLTLWMLAVLFPLALSLIDKNDVSTYKNDVSTYKNILSTYKNDVSTYKNEVSTVNPIYPVCNESRPLKPCFLRSRTHECSRDRPCKTGRLCCIDVCGIQVCQLQISPSSPTVGRCPDEPVGLSCPVIPALHRCHNNKHCGTGYCCENACGTRVCRGNQNLPYCVVTATSCAGKHLINKCVEHKDCRAHACGVCCRQPRCGTNECQYFYTNYCAPLTTLPPTKCPPLSHFCKSGRDCGSGYCKANECGSNECKPRIFPPPWL